VTELVEIKIFIC